MLHNVDRAESKYMLNSTQNTKMKINILRNRQKEFARRYNQKHIRVIKQSLRLEHLRAMQYDYVLPCIRWNRTSVPKTHTHCDEQIFFYVFHKCDTILFLWFLPPLCGFSHIKCYMLNFIGISYNFMNKKKKQKLYAFNAKLW